MDEILKLVYQARRMSINVCRVAAYKTAQVSINMEIKKAFLDFGDELTTEIEKLEKEDTKR